MRGVSFVRIRALMVLPALAFAAALAAPASASQLVNRDVRNIQLAVNSKGEALVTYRTVRGQTQHVLAWGAINARQPNRAVSQQRFKLDYAGGWRKYHKLYWKTFRNSCGAYDGPALAWMVTGCKSPDGSYWALQKWQVQLPDLGFTPWTTGLRQWELHLSHWTTDLAKVEVWQDWIYHGRFRHLFGRYTYLGKPVYGFGTTQFGAPTDGYGRLLYLDTHNSAYGSGWRRENSFVAHNPTGVFCYGFYPFDPQSCPHPPGWPKGKLRGPGTGARYRLTVEGPGVTPDVSVVVPGLHDYDPQNPADVGYEKQQNAILDSIVGADKLCRKH